MTKTRLGIASKQKAKRMEESEREALNTQKVGCEECRQWRWKWLTSRELKFYWNRSTEIWGKVWNALSLLLNATDDFSFIISEVPLHLTLQTHQGLHKNWLMVLFPFFFMEQLAPHSLHLLSVLFKIVLELRVHTHLQRLQSAFVLLIVFRTSCHHFRCFHIVKQFLRFLL